MIVINGSVSVAGDSNQLSDNIYTCPLRFSSPAFLRTHKTTLSAALKCLWGTGAVCLWYAHKEDRI